MRSNEIKPFKPQTLKKTSPWPSKPRPCPSEPRRECEIFRELIAGGVTEADADLPDLARTLLEWHRLHARHEEIEVGGARMGRGGVGCG